MHVFSELSPSAFSATYSEINLYGIAAEDGLHICKQFLLVDRNKAKVPLRI